MISKQFEVDGVQLQDQQWQRGRPARIAAVPRVLQPGGFDDGRPSVVSAQFILAELHDELQDHMAARMLVICMRTIMSSKRYMLLSSSSRSSGLHCTTMMLLACL